MYGAWIAKGMYLKERIVLFLFFPILELLGTCLHLMLSRTSSQYERMEDIVQVHRIGLPRQLNSLGHGEGVRDRWASKQPPRIKTQSRIRTCWLSESARHGILEYLSAIQHDKQENRR